MEEEENYKNSQIKLKEIFGKGNCFDFCLEKNLLIYSVNSTIIYFDVKKNERNFINFHQSKIKNLKFSPKGNFFISIDSNKFPCLALWEIPTLELIHREFLSTNFFSSFEENKKEKKQTKNFDFFEDFNKKYSRKIKKIYLDFLKENFFGILINVEIEFDKEKNKKNHKQIFYFFEKNETKIKLKFFKKIEENEKCLGIKFLPNERLISLEKFSLKFWKIYPKENLIKIKRKIHLNYPIIKNQIVFHWGKTNKILFLNEENSCMILDEEGNFLMGINSNKEKNEFFHKMKIFENKLYLQTNKNNLNLYDLEDFDYLGNIKLEGFDFVLEKNIFGEKNYLDLKKISSNKNFILEDFYLKEKINLLIMIFDKNFIYFTSISDKFNFKNKLSKKENRNLAVKESNEKEFNLEKEEFLNKIKNPNSNKTFFYSHSKEISEIFFTKNNSFFLTASKDDTIIKWNFNKKGKIYKNSLFNLPQKDKNYITVIIPHNRNPQIFLLGDNIGNILLFDFNFDKSPKVFNVGNCAIFKIKFLEKEENLVSIGFKNGEIILFDFVENFNKCITIEGSFIKNADIIEREKRSSILCFSELLKKTNKNKKEKYEIISLSSKKSIRIQTIKKSYPQKEEKITLKYKNKEQFSKKTKNIFNFIYQIQAIEIHKSKEYSIILFENNTILITKIQLDSICGIITLNNQFLNFYEMQIDPSGLYLAIVSDFFANEKQVEKIFSEKNSKEYSNTTDFNFVEESVRRKSCIIFYEIGTGKFASIMKNIFEISKISFSSDGRILCVGSDYGDVSLWGISKEMKENIFKIENDCVGKINFWSCIRIDFISEEDKNLLKKKFFGKKEENFEKNKKLIYTSFGKFEFSNSEKNDLNYSGNGNSSSYRSIYLNVDMPDKSNKSLNENENNFIFSCAKFYKNNKNSNKKTLTEIKSPKNKKFLENKNLNLKGREVYFDYVINNNQKGNCFSDIVYSEPDDIDNEIEEKENRNNIFPCKKRNFNEEIYNNSSDQIEILESQINKFEKKLYANGA